MANGIKIADIKKELSNDEKVLESAFKLESLYKKYKLLIWAIIIVVVGGFGGKAFMDNVKQNERIEANEALLTLQKNPNDKKALGILKEKNVALYELYALNKAVKEKDAEVLQQLSHSTNEVIADASRYSESVLASNPKDSTLYNEMSIFQDAYVDIKKGNVKEARNKLELIDERSAFGRVSQFLKHATLKVK